MPKFRILQNIEERDKARDCKNKIITKIILVCAKSKSFRNRKKKKTKEEIKKGRMDTEGKEGRQKERKNQRQKESRGNEWDKKNHF